MIGESSFYISGNTSDAESVEGNVPDQFFPLGLCQVVVTLQGTVVSRIIAANSCVRGPAGAATEHDRPVFQVMDDARFDAIEADEAESAENLFRRKELRQLFRVAQSVSQRDDCRLRPDQGRQQFRELIVGGRFQPDQHNVADADFVRGPAQCGGMVKLPAGCGGHTALPYGVVVGAEQEMESCPARPSRSWLRSVVVEGHRLDHGSGSLFWTAKIRPASRWLIPRRRHSRSSRRPFSFRIPKHAAVGVGGHRGEHDLPTSCRRPAR